MYSFFKKKACAADVAVGLIILAKGSRQSDAGWLSSLQELGMRLDSQRILDELHCLRLFAALYAVSETLGDKPENGPVLDAFYAQFEKTVKEYPEDTPLLEELKKRVALYTQAASVPHHHGPGWTIGCVFAEVCGGKEDLRLVTMGGFEFKLVLKAASEYVNRFRIISGTAVK